MQMRNMCLSIAFFLTVTLSAIAQNHIVSFGGGVYGTDYEIADGAREITIYNANGIAYAFWAENNGGGPGTGVINSITLAAPGSMTGDFSLTIADPNYPNDPTKPGGLS